MGWLVQPSSAMDKASLYLAPIDRRAAAFDPQSIRQWRDAVGVSEESLGRAAQLDCIAGAEAQQNGLRYRGFVKAQTLE